MSATIHVLSTILAWYLTGCLILLLSTLYQVGWFGWMMKGRPEHLGYELRWKLVFEDQWIGRFWCKRREAWYVCFVPWLALRIRKVDWCPDPLSQWSIFRICEGNSCVYHWVLGFSPENAIDNCRRYLLEECEQNEDEIGELVAEKRYNQGESFKLGDLRLMAKDWVEIYVNKGLAGWYLSCSEY